MQSEEKRMSIKDSKVVVVGVGNVGATVGFSIVNQGLCDRLVLIDVNRAKAEGEALDMQDSVSFMNRNVKVSAGTYDDCADADVAVITASAPMDPNANNRLDMLSTSKKIMKSIVDDIMKSGFDGILLIVSNPVDIMTYYAWKLSGLPRERVIGSGTTLDTARLRRRIGGMYDLSSKSVDAYVMGEHGDSEMVSWNSATVGGKNIKDVMTDNPNRTKDETLDDLRKQTIQAGWDIFSRKHNTCYGIAASVTAILKSILFNENQIYPVCVCLNGQYGLNDVFLSVPTILDRTGAKEIVEIKLADDEKENLGLSAEVVKNFYPDL